MLARLATLLALTPGAVVSSRATPVPTGPPTAMRSNAVALPSYERGVLIVEVRDVQQQPVAGATVTAGASGAAPRTDQLGRVRIRLPQTVQVGDVLPLRFVAPVGRKLVLFSPWDEQAVVPRWDNEAVHFVRVLVVEPGVRQAVASGKFLEALVQQIEGKAARAGLAGAGEGKEAAIAAARQAALEEVSREYELPAAFVDSALRAWRPDSLYQRGLAALYKENFPEAVTNLEQAAAERRARRVAAEAAEYDAEFFLGQALYRRGQYADASAALGRASRLRPNDETVKRVLALAQLGAGELAGADTLLTRALATDLRAYGPDDPDVAIRLNNLGLVRQARGDLAAADTLLRRALAIRERALGPDDWAVAVSLNNLGALRRARGDLIGADTLLHRALAISVRELGPDDPYVAIHLINLGLVRQARGDFAGADTLIARGVAINTGALAPDHPDVATGLSILGSVRRELGDLAGADTLLRRALAIRERTLGPEHPSVAMVLSNLAEVWQDLDDLAGADTLLRRALAIRERVLGPDHPETKATREALAALAARRAAKPAVPPLQNIQ